MSPTRHSHAVGAQGPSPTQLTLSCNAPSCSMHSRNAFVQHILSQQAHTNTPTYAPSCSALSHAACTQTKASAGCARSAALNSRAHAGARDQNMHTLVQTGRATRANAQTLLPYMGICAQKTVEAHVHTKSIRHTRSCATADTATAPADLLRSTGREILRGTTLAPGRGGVASPSPSPAVPSCCCCCCLPGVLHLICSSCCPAKPRRPGLPATTAAASAALCCCCCWWAASARCSARQQPSRPGQHISSRWLLMRPSQRCSPQAARAGPAAWCAAGGCLACIGGVHVHMCICVCVCVFACVHVCPCMCMCVCVCACMCICIRACVCGHVGVRACAPQEVV